MAHHSKFFGFWITVLDELTAQEAVKMAGLPVFLMGWNCALLSLIALVKMPINMINVAGMAILALFLIVLGLRIRAGHAGWMPLALVLFAIFIILNIAGSYLSWHLMEKNPISPVAIISGWIVPLFCASLTLSGVKGWSWMKAHKIRMSY